MSPSGPGPLAALIGRHKAGRSYAELAEASGGVISSLRWEELELLPLGRQSWLSPTDMEAVAMALGLTPETVRHYVLASRGLPASSSL